MKKNHIINHSRFQKRYDQNVISNYLPNENSIVKFPKYFKSYYEFFNVYAKKNYKQVSNNCLCGEKNDILLSLTDRHGVDFVTVVCKNCGLIRAKDYFEDDDVKDFYENFYRSYTYNEEYKKSSAEIFKSQKDSSKFMYDLIKDNKKKLNNLKIVDLGGGAGGALDHFDNTNEKYLFDFYDPYLKYAETKGIRCVKGGLDKINFKPDIIILSHVIEHWSNFSYEIQKLIDVQKINHTLNYIEFPGVDSIKKGRREGDILGDIHVPHVYYFTSYVFENLMNRHGFEKVYLDSIIRSVFVYTGKKTKVINFYKLCQSDLVEAEKARKVQILKNIIKLFLPKFIIKLIRKILKKENQLLKRSL